MTDLAEPALAPPVRRTTPYYVRHAPTAFTSPPVDRGRGEREAHLDLLLQRVSSFVTLERGWDEEGGEPIDASAVQRAYSFLSRLSVTWLPWVAPTTDGGVRVEWEANESFLMIQFEPEGHAEVNFRLNGGEPATLCDSEIPDDLGRLYEEVRRARS